MSSTYTPFFRRFANERALELREAEAHYARVKAWQDAFAETNVSIGRRLIEELGDFPEAVFRPAAYAIFELLELERHIFELPPPDFQRMNMQEFVEYRNLLHRKEHFFANQAELLRLLLEGLESVLAVVHELPETQDPTPFTIPFVCALPNPRLAVEAMLGNLSEYRERGLFVEVTDRLYRNLCHASGRDPQDRDSRKPLRLPTESTLPLDELVAAYLGGTPFHDLFMAPVPLKLTHEDRFSHWHVLAGSGQGKTVLIENVIMHDLRGPDPPSIVLIDPHSDLVRKLMRSDLGIEDRIILIDPRDTAHPLALNPLALNRTRLETYDEVMREQVTAGVIQTFGYLWSGLTNLTLTGKQEVFFRYVTRLLLTIPEVEGRNATILDMLHLMHDPAPYGAVIERLPPIPREFFMRDFLAKTFEGTKEQIRYRIQAVIESPTMARLFTSPETKVDFFTEMNRGAVILVDTAKDFLKDGSAIFGKLMISLILQAVLERAAIPEAERKPTFLLVDEAGSFFSSNIDDLLTEARKYKCGLLLAHQYLDQATSALRASLAANAAIKFAAGLSAQDASTMAREMRTTPDFILGQPKLQFAAHIRNVTPSAVSIPIAPVRDVPGLSEDERRLLIDRNRMRVSMTDAPSPAPSPATPAASVADSPKELDPDISPTW